MSSQANGSYESQPLLSSNSIEPKLTLWSSLKAVATNSYFNILLVFVPIALGVSAFGASDGTVFALNFIAIIPLAKLLGFATEELALRTGSTIGSLLNATFGNAVELILGIIALKEGLIRVVQASILGSILSNILLVLGFCFLFGGLKYDVQEFKDIAAQTSSSLLALTVLALLIPAAFAASTTADEAKEGILALSHGTALILLIIYVLFLVFQLKTHARYYEDEFTEEETPQTTLLFSGILLVVVAGLVSLHAENLVGAIEGVVEQWGINETFVGIILLPLVGKQVAAEHVSSVTFAMKNKMNLAIGIALSSSLQIGLLVTPVLVIAGWIIGEPMTLYFENFETIVLFASVLIVNYLIQDSKSNWLEGAMLLCAYAIVGIAFYFHPAS